MFRLQTSEKCEKNFFITLYFKSLCFIAGKFLEKKFIAGKFHNAMIPYAIGKISKCLKVRNKNFSKFSQITFFPEIFTFKFFPKILIYLSFFLNLSLF